MPNERAEEGPFSIPVPMVLEQDGRGERAYDIYSRLLKDRIILIGTPIVSTVANLVIAQLLVLENQDSGKPVTIYLNTPGGEIDAGLAIYDTMQRIKPPVSTVCFGIAASMGAVLLAGGTTGRRLALPHSRILIHQPLGGVQGQASDIDIQVQELSKLKNSLYKILSKHTGQSVDKITKDADRDFWLNPEEAKEYGLIDEVLNPPEKK